MGLFNERVKKIRKEYEEIVGKKPYGFNFDEWNNIEEYTESLENEIKKYKKKK